MIHCISKEASMRAKHILCFYKPESRANIWPVTLFLPPPPTLLVALAAVHSKAVLLLFIHCLLLLPFFGGLCKVLVFMQCSVSFLAIILPGKRESFTFNVF